MSTPSLALRGATASPIHPDEPEGALPRRLVPPGLPESRVRYAAQAFLALSAILLLSPILLLVALAVKLTSKGPLFYGGVRVGKNQQLYTMYKFRTLREGSERQIGARLLSPQDDFYTPIGKFLKRSKLDEVPQLINVLRGEMNFAGPRPLRPIFLDRYLDEIEHYADRFRVAPGMTGLAQVRGGYFTSPRNKLRYDRLYVAHRSLWLDAQLVGLTALKLLNRWITLGASLLVLLLFVSFIPPGSFERMYVTVGGAKLNPLHGLIAFAAAWMLMRRSPSDRISLYRTPINLPMACFMIVSLVSAVLAAPDSRVQAIRGAAYYLITGFIVLLAIVNGTFTRTFARSAVSAVALTSVAISTVGILEVVFADYLPMKPSPMETGLGFAPTGISSTLGSPIALATYLLLGVPCVLCSLSRAHTREGRDFWVAASTICLLGILLTRHPAGLLTLSIIAAIYLWRHLSPTWAAVFLAIVVPATVLSIHRNLPDTGWWSLLCGSSPAGCEALSQATPRQLLFGLGPRTLGQVKLGSDQFTSQVITDANGNVRLLLENGVLGWLAMLWILVQSMSTLYRAQRSTEDPGLRAILWAVMAGLIGFFVAMQSFDPFNNIAIQLLFWGLLGIGIGIVVRLGERPSDYRIAVKLGH
ncbi:MAG: sugar transferase [Alphaproteobacteria bacterium]